jgi:hypothetical protein
MPTIVAHHNITKGSKYWLTSPKRKEFFGPLGVTNIRGRRGCALASTAGAQLLDHKDLSASIAITVAQTAIETCKANGYAVSATVVGRNGEIIVQVRGDNPNVEFVIFSH